MKPSTLKAVEKMIDVQKSMARELVNDAHDPLRKENVELDEDGNVIFRHMGLTIDEDAEPRAHFQIGFESEQHKNWIMAQMAMLLAGDSKAQAGIFIMDSEIFKYDPETGDRGEKGNAFMFSVLELTEDEETGEWVGETDFFCLRYEIDGRDIEFEQIDLGPKMGESSILDMMKRIAVDARNRKPANNLFDGDQVKIDDYTEEEFLLNTYMMVADHEDIHFMPAESLAIDLLAAGKAAVGDDALKDMTGMTFEETMEVHQKVKEEGGQPRPGGPKTEKPW